MTQPHDAEQAPELAVLSALAHAGRDGWDKVVRALLHALAAVDAEHATLYSDVVLAALPDAARGELEAHMAARRYEYQSDFVRRYVFQGRAEGRVEGEARAVLAVLEARGLDVSDDARARITACGDPEQLEAWIRRAAVADRADDVFV